VDLYFFDFDKTLYAYDSQKRLPAQAAITGVSQYHLAKTWWAAGFEERAEAGEWPSSAEYLSEFERITGGRMTLAEWTSARAAASTPITATVEALRRASSLGTVSLLSNNPAPFVDALPELAPDVVALIGENRLVSCQLGVRKPSPAVYLLALERFGARAEDTFFVDDLAANVAGAASVGIHAHHFTGPSPEAADALFTAIDSFAARNS
jgi:glucose-1-phosphatase